MKLSVDLLTLFPHGDQGLARSGPCLARSSVNAAVQTTAAGTFYVARHSRAVMAMARPPSQPRRDKLKAMMDRRQTICAMLGVSVGALRGQEMGKIPLSAADAVAEGVPRFLSKAELVAFADLARTLVPAFDGRPGAVEAEAPQFLDFLLSLSTPEVQQLYRAGLARFAKTKDATPLNRAWTYAEPQDAYHRFLRAARTALYQATVNSKPWAEAMSQRSRGSSATGLYWLPLD